MKKIVKRSNTSNLLRVFLQDSTSTTGAGKTGLLFSTSGLIISTIADNEATATTYTSAGSTIETITTLGTYATPTATKCRFKEVDATNFPGVYEIQLADARFAVANSQQLLVSILCTGTAPVYVEYQLVAVDPYDTVRFGLTALPNTAVTTNGSLITAGTGTAQLSTTSGVALANTTQWNSVAVTGMPMPTYTQPTGFLTATFPTTVASTTNITAGTITSVTNSVTANTTQWGGVAVTGMPMPTYTQPTGFLAATFPTTVASTTNITSATGVTLATGSIASTTFADSALVIGSAAGTGVKAYMGANSITAGVVADGAIDAATFADSALVIGAAAGVGTKAYLGANSVTAGVIATDAIDADAIANSAITIRLSSDGTASEGRIVAGTTAADVWNALVSAYDATSANTTATMAKAILKSDQTSKNGDVTMYSISGTNGIDVDIHRIANDATAATNLKNALNGTGGVTISATLDALSSTERNAISDALLARNIAGGSSTGRLVKDALRALRNKSAIVGTTLTVYAEDDTTAAWTATVSSSATADPVTGIDPA